MLDGVGVDWGVVDLSEGRSMDYKAKDVMLVGLWIRLVLSAWTEITSMYVVCCLSYLNLPYDTVFFPIKKL